MNTSPTRVLNPFPGVEVRLFGRNKGKTDWSIADLSPEYEKKTGRPRVLSPVFNLIHEVSFNARVHDLYAPKPSTFNTVVCRSSDLTELYTNDTDVTEADAVDLHQLSIHRGVLADGCDIPAFQHLCSGYWLSSADCVCIVARAKSGLTLACHAGRDCLVDRKLLDTGTSGRQNPAHPSVVDSLMARFSENGDKPADIKFFLTCGIAPEAFRHPWDHPKFGASNRKLIVHLTMLDPMCVLGDPSQGRISLNAIIIAQLGKYGVSMGQITDDGIDTFVDKDDDGEYTWHSHARTPGPMRNGVMIINRG